jgi:DNA polymerase III epsilon subunit-like protein
MYLAFDTETSGLNPIESNLLTAYFIVLDDNLNTIDTFDLKLQHPVYSITAKALEINKIDILKHDRESISVLNAKEQFKNFLIKNKGLYRYTPIGHNIQFDIKFLLASGLISEKDYSQYISACSLDTMIIANFLKLSGDLRKNIQLNLTSLCKHYCINSVNAHNCEADIKMTIELLKKMTSVKSTSNNRYEINNINKKRKMI